jgi:chorismate dehydratase
MLKVAAPVADAPGSPSRACLRIGAVNYLNTKPLIYELDQLAPDADVILDLPSRLADQLALGELDVALIPVVEYLRAGRYALIPDIAIASRGPVLSVTLFSKKPWPEISSIALDEGSRTSAALVQVLSRFRYEVTPRLEALSVDADPERVATDAVLLIGDRAMHACLPGFPHAYDLGEEWTKWTDLPFVFAVWAVRPGIEPGGLVESLQEAKRRGLANAASIAAAEGPRLGLGPGFCRRYLDTVLSYDLGPRELAGLKRFANMASQLGLIPKEISVDECGRAHISEGR